MATRQSSFHACWSSLWFLTKAFINGLELAALDCANKQAVSYTLGIRVRIFKWLILSSNLRIMQYNL